MIRRSAVCETTLAPADCDMSFEPSFERSKRLARERVQVTEDYRRLLPIYSSFSQKMLALCEASGHASSGNGAGSGMVEEG